MFKKSVILIKKNFFILDGEEYDFDKVNEIYDLLRSNIIMIILEEDLHMKPFIYNTKKLSLYKFVCNKINNAFPQNGDILYDYEKKNNIINVYSIRGAKRVEKLSQYAKNIEVKPLQVIIKEIMIRKLKKKFFTAKLFIKFEEIYYYISFKYGLYDYGFVEVNKDLVIDKINNIEDEEIYVDDNTINMLLPKTELNLIKINFGELIYDKIYKK